MGIRISGPDAENATAGRLKAGLALLPLLAVVLASVFAIVPEDYRPSGIPKSMPGYPIEIDLVEVRSATSRRDGLRIAAQTERRDTAFARMERLLADQLREQQGIELVDASATSATPIDLAANSSGEVIAGNPTRRPVRSGSLMGLDFDLAGGPNSSGALQVSKNVQLGQRALGQVAVRIDNTSTIFISRADVLRILPADYRPGRQLSGDFLALSSLRDAGVDLRYDPVSDSLVLNVDPSRAGTSADQ